MRRNAPCLGAKGVYNLPFHPESSAQAKLESGERYGQSASWQWAAKGRSQKAPDARQDPAPEVSAGGETGVSRPPDATVGETLLSRAGHMVRPPSTTSTWPVMSVLPSARKTTASAMSSG